MSHFNLSKWYLDCVTDDGEVFIGYAASLRWRDLKLNYSSTLRHHRGVTQSKSSLSRNPVPEISGASLHWNHKQLKTEGVWTATAKPIESTIYESADGCVQWQCLMPGAMAEVTAGDRRLNGFGYAEHLTMSIPPWRLPIDELRWGRFVSAGDALVWIDWKGPYNRQLVFRNGVNIENAIITDTMVAMSDGAITLTLDQGQVLREGPLIQTALAKIPGIQNLIPARSLQADECKWLSRASLTKPSADPSSGWAIHEVVRWPKAAG